VGEKEGYFRRSGPKKMKKPDPAVAARKGKVPHVRPDEKPRDPNL